MVAVAIFCGAERVKMRIMAGEGHIMEQDSTRHPLHAWEIMQGTLNEDMDACKR